jgi:hypothetical protein
MAQLQPGPHLYFDGIGNKPVPVVLREVDKHTLGVFYEGRQDYDLVEEVSGRFEPRLLHWVNGSGRREPQRTTYRQRLFPASCFGVA